MPPRTRRPVALAAALAVLAVGLVVWHLRRDTDRPPLTAESVRAVLDLRMLNPLEPYPFDIPDLRGARTRFQTFRADLSWTPPPGFDGTWRRGHFAILVAAKRKDLPPPRVWSHSPSGAPTVAGVSIDRLPDALGWLHGVEYRQAISTKTSPSAGRVTFVVAFRFTQQVDSRERRILSIAPPRVADLMVTLTFIGPDGRLYWAQRLHG
jgi:hypothetical protein